MTITIPADVMERIRQHGEACYPEEGAGLLLGRLEGNARLVADIHPIENTFDPQGRARRYRLEPSALLAAEREAEAQGLEVLGVFHSHPDHPDQPSDYDRDWALPWLDRKSVV